MATPLSNKVREKLLKKKEKQLSRGGRKRKNEIDREREKKVIVLKERV